MVNLTNASFCYTTGNFSANSTYAKNRDLVLHSLASNVTANGGFYSTTIGLGNDTVYGLVLCMTDPSAQTCSRCVNSTIQGLLEECPNQKEAISWGGDPVPCIVRYANRYFLGSLELSPGAAGYNIETNWRQFGQIWSILTTDIVTRASIGSSSRLKFAAETADLTSTQKIYVFMQCTPDISQSNCSDCLQESVAFYKNCCYGHQGGYVNRPNCVLRWDLYPFYNLFPEVSSPSPSPSPRFVIGSPSPSHTTIREEKEGKASQTVIVTVIPTVIFLALVILSTFTIFRFRKPKKEVKGNFTSNSTYAKNRDLVLRSLASNVTANRGFYNTTIGFGNDTVYGLVLCMSDPSAQDCSSCVNSAIQSLIEACPAQKEAISWGGDPVPCIVHYANRYFFGSLALSPTDAGFNLGNLETNLTQFGQIWSGLMAETVTRASMGSSSRLKFAAETADLTSTQKIYVFMQCTPDISQSSCSYCLQESVANFKSCCYGKQGGYVQKPNCVLRWDLYPFYNLFPEVPSPSPPFIISSPSPTNTTVKKEKENTASRTVIVTVIPTVIFLALVILTTFTIFRFRKPKKEISMKIAAPNAGN
ncbi:unnamed protein product [Dovyalis caffra]|uniref:Gnk2-homologous domain-containing protein n=1 Tax=Dovyalis caffra TaxID=77055 RepID=A0AAV1SIM9_9ROSI|nr:unnamed protein product [Dovyalis caffra]